MLKGRFYQTPIFAFSLVINAHVARSKLQANLGETEVQSVSRYGNPFYTSTIPSGTLRLYHTLDHKYLVQQLFTRADIVETICYIKMGNAAYIPLPITQSETDQLRDANIPADTTFPATTVSLGKGVENEKVWKSDNGKYYINIGSMSAKDSPFWCAVGLRRLCDQLRIRQSPNFDEQSRGGS